MKKHIPNLITSLNLFTGCIAVFYAFREDYQAVLILTLLAAAFDFLDGLAARILNAYSPMGKELDSLADMVSFGLVPGALAFSILNNSCSCAETLSFFGFIITIFSALRLAKFNIDDRQSTSFVGLPTPANALFWVGLTFTSSEFISQHPSIVFLLIGVFSWLLVSRLPMFSLKLKSLDFKTNISQFVLVIGGIILVAFFQLDAVALIILLYIIISALNFFTARKKNPEL